MVKVSFDVSKSNAADAVAGGGAEPTAGVYLAKVAKLSPGHKKGADGKPDKSAPRLEVQVQLLKPNGKPDKYVMLYDYIAFTEASEWKLDQFLQCFGIASGSKRKGSFDTNKITGQKFTARVKDDTYEGQRKGRLAAYIMLDEDAEDEDEDELDDEIEEEELDDEIEDDDDLDEDEEDEEDDEEEDIGEYDEDSLGKMTLVEIKRVATDMGIKPMPRGKANIIAAIMEGEEEAEEEEAEEAALEAEYAMEDIEEMSVGDLKELFEEYDLELPARKTKKALIAALAATGLIEEDDEQEPF